MSNILKWVAAAVVLFFSSTALCGDPDWPDPPEMAVNLLGDLDWPKPPGLLG